VHLISEVDGLRIISSQVCDFVQKVQGQSAYCVREIVAHPFSDALLAVFSPGSTHPAAILYDALDHFDRKSPKADDCVRSIRAELADAVDTCVEAAGRQSEVNWQRRLLRVSSAMSSSPVADVPLGGSIWPGFHGFVQS
jgi:hypothetical protein